MARTRIGACVLALLTVAARIAAQDDCSSSCSDYNSILEGCSDGDDTSCVCNDANFQDYVNECIACTGTGSAPYQYQQSCKTVAPDCTYACSGYALISQSCGDPSASGYASCMCSSAYDITYSNTFNQDFTDCVTCESGGGVAAGWEATCCAMTGNCVGMSPQASAEAATMPAASPTAPVASSSTQPVPAVTSSAAAHSVNAVGLGLAPLLLDVLLGVV